MQIPARFPPPPGSTERHGSSGPRSKMVCSLMMELERRVEVSGSFLDHLGMCRFSLKADPVLLNQTRFCSWIELVLPLSRPGSPLNQTRFCPKAAPGLPGKKNMRVLTPHGPQPTLEHASSSFPVCPHSSLLLISAVQGQKNLKPPSREVDLPQSKCTIWLTVNFGLSFGTNWFYPPPPREKQTSREPIF